MSSFSRDDDDDDEKNNQMETKKMTNLLEQYADIQVQIKELQAQILDLHDKAAEIFAQLEPVVAEHGDMSGYGYVARLAPGRKSTDHEAAVKATMAEYAEHGYHSLAHELRELQEKHSTTKVTVAWAKVTATAKIDTSPFTTQAPSVFVIEPVKK